MTHPLFSLLSQSANKAPESPPVDPGPSVADSAALTATTQQRTRDEACAVSAVPAAIEPGMGVPVSSGVSIFAVAGPGKPNGKPTEIQFAPGLTQAQRREILTDLEWFEAGDRRRERERLKREAEKSTEANKTG